MSENSDLIRHIKPRTIYENFHFFIILLKYIQKYYYILHPPAT